MGGTRSRRSVSLSEGHRIAWKAAAKLQGAASAVQSPVRCGRCRASSSRRSRGTLDRPPPACSLSRPSGPGAKPGGGQSRRPWTSEAELPPRSPSPLPLPSPTPSVPSLLVAFRPGKAGERGGLTRRKKKRGWGGEARVFSGAIAPRNRHATERRDNFYPFCAPFLPNPKMKGQKLALTLTARMATCAFSAASPGEKALRA